MKKFKNWKTTVGGLLITIGQGFVLGEGKLKIIGVVLSGLGGLILGAAAKDKNVTGGTVKQ